MLHQAVMNVVIRRRYFLLVQRLSSTASVGEATAGSRPLPLLLVPRRALLLYKEQMKPSMKHGEKSKPSTEEQPWPRKLVYAAYAAVAIFLPYSTAWFLSTNARIRSIIFKDDQFALLDRMRQHFGVEDWESISEPEAVLNVAKIPHKFADEPAARIRQQQAWIDELNQSVVTVRLFPQALDGNAINAITGDPPITFRVARLRAGTLARHEDLAEALKQEDIRPPVAVDFPDDVESNEEMSNSIDVVLNESALRYSTKRETTLPSLSIYSLWHYQAPVATVQTNVKANMTKMSDTDMELSRLDHEISVMQNELDHAASSHRPIDDIRDELRQLQSAKRRLQWKLLIPWSR